MNAVLSEPIPELSDAKLPVVYEAAVKAIAECDRVDECKTWSDKAAAIRSYAKQANDDRLKVMAMRIMARAERRGGLLLKQVERGDEATRFGQSDGKVGTHPPVNRALTAKQAGISDHQRKTMLRVANVPEESFVRQVESPRPPTVTQLAAQGTVRRLVPEAQSQPPTITELAARGTVSCPVEAPTRTYVPDDVQPAPVGQATKALGLLREFAAFCGTTDAAGVARACASLDIEALHSYVGTIDEWLDRFAPNLPAEF